MSMFSFELKKILFSKRFLYTLIIFALLIVGLFIRNLFFLDLVQEQEENKVIEYTREVQANLNSLGLMLESNPEDTIKKEQYKHLGIAVNALYDWRSLISSEDWRAALTKQNEFLSALILYKELKGEFSLTTKEIKSTLALNEQHLTVGIRPESEQYSTSLPNFMKLVTSVYVNLGAIIILLLIVGDGLTAEFEQRSIQFLYTQPIKKHAILHAKYGTAIVVYIGITALLYAVTWLCGLLIGESGTFQYPVLLQFEEPYKFITIGEYIQWSLIGTTVTVVMVISLYLFISLIVKQTIVTLLITIILLVGGFFATQAISSDVLSFVNPFALVFAGVKVLNVAELWGRSVPIIIVLAIVLYGLTLVKIKRTF